MRSTLQRLYILVLHSTSAPVVKTAKMLPLIKDHLGMACYLMWNRLTKNWDIPFLKEHSVSTVFNYSLVNTFSVVSLNCRNCVINEGSWYSAESCHLFEAPGPTHPQGARQPRSYGSTFLTEVGKIHFPFYFWQYNGLFPFTCQSHLSAIKHPLICLTHLPSPKRQLCLYFCYAKKIPIASWHEVIPGKYWYVISLPSCHLLLQIHT